MKITGNISIFLAAICSALIINGCGNEEKAKVAETQKPDAQQAVPQTTTPIVALPLGTTVQLPEAPDKPNNPSDVIVEVEGAKLTQGQIDSELRKKLIAMKGKIPAGQLPQAKENIKKRIMDDFVIRTLLTNEVKRRKITATEKEITEGIDQVKASLPPNITIDDLMKKNQVTREQMRQEIAFGIKIKKLVGSSKIKSKPSDKDINNFYKKNRDKFKSPETARARHILIAKAAGDDEKTKLGKKAKAENLRQQLLAGADFADLAAKNSDCPSKQSGGDLGVFPRGQMVKPFDAVAFSQKINDISPVVETDFGYHVIQVTERNPSKQLSLDKDVKEKISAFLVGQKQEEAFRTMITQLRGKANVVVYKKP